jgi:hypothetical protein
MVGTSRWILIENLSNVCVCIYFFHLPGMGLIHWRNFASGDEGWHQVWTQQGTLRNSSPTLHTSVPKKLLIFWRRKKHSLIVLLHSNGEHHGVWIWIQLIQDVLYQFLQIVIYDCVCIDLCGLVVRVPGYKSRSLGSVPSTTRFSEK